MARFNPLDGALDTGTPTPLKPTRDRARHAPTSARKANLASPQAAATAPLKPARRYTVDARTLSLATIACLTGNPDAAYNEARRGMFADFCDAHPEHAPDWRKAWRAFADLPPAPSIAVRVPQTAPLDALAAARARIAAL